MRVERKSSNKAGVFWLIVFKNNDDKRETLNELRLTERYLSKEGKNDLYALIRKISNGCRHDDRYNEGEEIATCIFDSSVNSIILFMSVFSSVIKKQNETIDLLEGYIEYLKDMIHDKSKLLDDYVSACKKIDSEFDSIISGDES